MKPNAVPRLKKNVDKTKRRCKTHKKINKCVKNLSLSFDESIIKSSVTKNAGELNLTSSRTSSSKEKINVVMNATKDESVLNSKEATNDNELSKSIVDSETILTNNSLELPDEYNKDMNFSKTLKESQSEIFKRKNNKTYKNVGTDCRLSTYRDVGTDCCLSTYRDVGTDCRLSIGVYNVHMFKNDNEGIHFYTGLECYDKFMLVYNTLSDYVSHIKYRYKKVLLLSYEDQLFLTLMKLRRNTPDYELSVFFGVCKRTVSNVFITWINFMCQIWSVLDTWPSKEIVQFYMPQSFKKEFSSTRLIVDGTEVPIGKPSNPIHQQASFSKYKNRNTLKALAVGTPDGLFSEVTTTYGGSASDRQIFERSGIINKCDKGDNIMADRGFKIQDICAAKDIKVNIPTFLKGASQLPGISVIADRKLSNKRVHIERLIGLMKTYKIFMTPMNPYYIPIASKIFKVCFMLCNFRESIVSRYS